MIYVVRYALISLYTVFWGLVAIAIAPFDRDGHWVCWVGRQWVGWIFRTCGIRVECEGLENVDPRQPYVFMNNHQSVVDIGALVATIPVDVHFIAKKELAWIPFFGWALALSVGIMIDRGKHRKAVQSLRRAAERIRRGANVIIFPEGTRSPTGDLQPLKSGGFHLAIQAQVPILPVTISGTHRITPKGSLRVESGTVKIVYGKPVPTRGLGPEDRQELKERVRQAILAGFDPLYQRLPARPAPPAC